MWLRELPLFVCGDRIQVIKILIVPMAVFDPQWILLDVNIGRSQTSFEKHIIISFDPLVLGAHRAPHAPCSSEAIFNYDTIW